MKKSSFLVSVLAIASTALVVIGIVLGFATGYNFIESTNEVTSMIQMCCVSGIIGLAITTITAALENTPKTTLA